MLELPEVEVLRRDLEKEVVGKRVKDVEVGDAGLVKPHHRTRPDFVKALEGRKIVGVRRRGKVIFVDLDEDQTWILDVGESGSVHRQTATEPAGTDTSLVVTFTTGGALHLTETDADTPASTGVVPTAEAFEAAGVDPSALDPYDDTPTWMEFAAFLKGAAEPLKLLLIDQDRIAGLGPVYSDEILWEAGLRWDRGSDTLSTQEVRRLYRAMQEVIHAAMKQRGSSLDESEPETAIDEEGEVAEHLKVYGREGLPCFRCRKPIVRSKIKRNVTTYHCEQCMI